METKEDKKRRLMDKVGITDARLFAKLNELLEAEKVIRDRDGDVVDREPDVVARANALEKCLKMKGYLADDKSGMNVLSLDSGMSQMILEATRKAMKKMEVDDAVIERKQ